MTIKNHITNLGKFIPTQNHGGTITPKFVVLHYTASWELDTVISRFLDPASRVSAHVSIGTGGETVQQVPYNVRGWHAGPSQHMGYSGINNHSIGIELVNPGFLKKASGGYLDAYGNFMTEHEVGPVVAAKYAKVGSGTFYWPLYPRAQLEALDAVFEEIVQKYNILDVVTHEEIDTRGWKTDPGPAFPMNRYKAKLMGGRESDGDTYAVTAPSLNMRSGPGTTFGVIGSLTKGQLIIEQGRQGNWVRVSDASWVHGGYLQRTA